MKHVPILSLIIVSVLSGCNTREYEFPTGADTLAGIPSHNSSGNPPPIDINPPVYRDPVYDGQLIPLAVGNRWRYRLQGAPTWFEFVQDSIIKVRELPYFNHSIGYRYDHNCKCTVNVENTTYLGTARWYFSNIYRQGGGLLYSPVENGIRLGTLLIKLKGGATEDSVAFAGFIPKVPAIGSAFRGGQWTGRRWITTPAGSFNCYVWTRQSRTQYFAPGVGVVRSDENGNGTNIFSLTFYFVR